MAIVSVNKNKIKMLAEKGNKSAADRKPVRRLDKIPVDDPGRDHLCGLLFSASAATGISQVLGGWMAQYGIPYSSTLAVVLVTIILSYCTLVFGELVP